MGTIMLSDQLKTIWAQLQDEMSKEYFRQRLLYLLDNDESHMERMILYSIEQWEHNIGKGKCLASHALSQFYKKYRNSNIGIVIFGAGGFGRQLLQWTTRHGFPVQCFCDNNPTKHNTEICSIPVISPEELHRYKKCPVIIAIKAEAVVSAIYTQLISLGIQEEYIYRMPGIAEYEYFDDSLIGHMKKEVFIDAGTYNGDTILQFAEFCNYGYKSIYGLEPDPISYERTVADITQSKLKNVNILNKGAWSSSQTLKFVHRENGGASIDENAGESCIQTITIDSLGEKPTFIKMDIEGSELEALRGARETITSCKPRLAVCLYHKKEDILDIPSFILSLAPEYKIFIRHHSLTNLDTVLYARF